MDSLGKMMKDDARRATMRAAPAREANAILLANVKRALKALDHNELSRARQFLERPAISAAINDASLARLREKLPPSPVPVPADVFPALMAHRHPVSAARIAVDVETVGAYLRSRSKLTSPGPSRVSFSRLRRFYDTSPAFAAALTFIVQRIIDGVMTTSETRDVFVRATLAAVPKVVAEGAPPDCRPIAISESLRNLCAGVAGRATRAIFASHSHPLDLGAGVPGATEIAAHVAATRLALESDLCILKIDMKNAFSTILRALVMLRVKAICPQLLFLLRTLYGKASTLEARHDDGSTSETHVDGGVFQGCPLSNMLFQATINAVNARVRAAFPDCTIVSYVDDLYIMGLFKDVLGAYEAYTPELAALGLVVQPAKCQILIRSTVRDYQEHRMRANAARLAVEMHGIVVLGSPVGSDNFVKFSIDSSAADLCARADRLMGLYELGAMPDGSGTRLHQTVTLISSCVPSGLTHLLRTVEPRLAIEAAGVLDVHVFNVVMRDLYQLTDDEMAVPGLRRHLSYRLFQRLSLGGMGFTSSIRACPGAFLGSVAQFGAAIRAALPAVARHALAPRAIEVIRGLDAAREFFATALVRPAVSDATVAVIEAISAAQPPVPALQNMILREVQDSEARNRLEDASRPAHMRRHEQSRLGPHALSWFARAGFHLTRLTDNEFRHAARLLLDVQCMLPQDGGVCVLCGMKTDNSHHSLVCQGPDMRGLATKRHSFNNEVLGNSIHRYTGARVISEPFVCRVLGIQVEGNTEFDKARRLMRADLAITINGVTHMLDGTFVSPDAGNGVGKLQVDAANRPGVMAEKAVALKRAKYHKYHGEEAAKALVIPAIESAGYIHVAARQFIRRLLRDSPDGVLEDHEVSRRLEQTLAEVTRANQRGNARMSIQYQLACEARRRANERASPLTFYPDSYIEAELLGEW